MSGVRALSLVSACSIGLGAVLGSTFERRRRCDDKNFSLTTRPNVFPAVVSAKTRGSEDQVDLIPLSISGAPVYPPSGQKVPPPSNIGSEIMRLGLPGMENLRTFEDHILSYDRRHRNPNWVFEHLTREKVKRNEAVDRVQCDFQTDEGIHPFFAATNDDFKRSGYDRGHMAAAANHRHSQSAMQQTFTLSNISPQVGKGFNRDTWCRLEALIRQFTKKYKNVYVCTGPLYLPKPEDGRMMVKYEVIGRNNVAVPTHFFKVVLMETDRNEFDLISFVLPNQVLSDQAPLRQYVVPVEAIERASGLLIFDKLPRNRLRQINNVQLVADS